MAMGSPGKRTRRRGRAPMGEINVTPLVDVMLVLLVIFMVTAPLLSAGVPVELPDSNADALAQTPNPVNLTITPDGRIFIDQNEVEEGTLGERLAALPRGADGKPPQVTLRADKALDYGRVMAVMGELNHAGFNSISLVTNAPAPVSTGSAAAP
ncbi:MAG: biopolymer transporter ExbD [Novosphingobium sp.]|uniref:biopolymer transporter ExbD n=1 Tax=Novosphingobium sp. TaxID=1874826 RepID=UPI001DC0528E|nr:biopolymer transporter ExbD [Novosphingobium sp.]MCB2058114.1 biopolymer transporter ExbD [Novosphingobium sp.]MCP5387310.1 biopolymer transporter ExbD [Novosphingobium sp.]